MIVHSDMTLVDAQIAVFLGRLDGAMEQAGTELMTRNAFRAQQIVHVVTGALQASIRPSDPERLGPFEVEVDLVAGNDGDLGYAAFEEDLHPFLRPAMEGSESDAEFALLTAFESAG